MNLIKNGNQRFEELLKDGKEITIKSLSTNKIIKWFQDNYEQVVKNHLNFDVGDEDYYEHDKIEISSFKVLDLEASYYIDRIRSGYDQTTIVSINLMMQVAHNLDEDYPKGCSQSETYQHIFIELEVSNLSEFNNNLNSIRDTLNRY